MDQPRAGCSRRAALSVLLIIGLIAVCLGAATVAADRVCVNGFNERLPLYPGATVKWERHNFLTVFGMGETVMTLYSPDDPDTVRSWYARTTSDASKRAISDALLRMAQSEWTVNRAEDGTGSQIILHGVCMQ